MAPLVGSTDPLPLAAGFAPPTLGEWRALVTRALRGAEAASLTTRGPDGLAIAPLDIGERAAHPTLARAAPPGGAAWDIRGFVDHPDPASANIELLEHLAGGAASALVAIDPTGARGVAIGSRADMARLLDSVVLEVAPIALDAGFLGPLAARWLGDTGKASPAAPLALHLDPLSSFAREGGSPGPIAAHLDAAATIAAELAMPYPNATLFLASGRVVHEAGGRPAEEIAFGLAAGLAYAKALGAAGVPPEDAIGRIVLGLCADADILVSIAKMRAARLAWSKLAAACGSKAPSRIEARSSGRMLAAADPWTNLIRLAVAGFAAAVGGADAIVLDAFTAPLGRPTRSARRISRNVQLIMMKEAHVAAAADPLAGAGAVEALTDDLARQAWRAFQRIEAAGGIAAVLEGGELAQRVGEAREELRAALADRSLRLIGVTDFRAEDLPKPEMATTLAAPVVAPDPRQPGPDSLCPPMAPITLEGLAATAA